MREARAVRELRPALAADSKEQPEGAADADAAARGCRGCRGCRGLVTVGMWARKGRVQDCRLGRRRSQLLASERAEGPLLGLGEDPAEELPKFPKGARRSSKFPVERTVTLGYLPPLPVSSGWRPKDGGAGGSRRESASASGGTVAGEGRPGHEAASTGAAVGHCTPACGATAGSRPGVSLRPGYVAPFAPSAWRLLGCYQQPGGPSVREGQGSMVPGSAWAEVQENEGHKPA